MAVRNPRVKTPAKKKVVVRKVGQAGKRKAQVKKSATRPKTPAKVASRDRQNPNVGSSFDNNCSWSWASINISFDQKDS